MEHQTKREEIIAMVASVIGIAAIVVASGGSALYLGGGIPGRSGNWGSSSSSKNNKPKNPSLYKNEEERGRLDNLQARDSL